ncbi:hypothetical protein AGDE_16523 [Angomonas deanei]|uniref:Intraflagellar transport protein 43, putative n=1 Tax=Angomonas deanei TaxID=59799 RepID=A0A7G2CNX4_9TRYP|nr:hypothetical protein AGDE_16523 [Angomonas deanei]CAD2221490.1 Intraflagellar transport protein 43, putative [Angomonas deanei]|eukprot:EPY16946.1 hypothetical protein AGDE_16523 [Angomonas deanei]
MAKESKSKKPTPPTTAGEKAPTAKAAPAKAAPVKSASAKKQPPADTTTPKRKPSMKDSSKHTSAAPTPKKGEPKHGRRAVGEAGDSPTKAAVKNSWMTSPHKKKVEDTILGKVQTVQDDVDENTGKEHDRKRRQAREDLENKLAVAPTGYQATLPKLSELDITSTWDKLLQSIHKEYDMSCLTGCLAQDLDEDAQWNPDMLLVQLTSDLLDAAERKAIEDPMSYNVLDEGDLGN